MSERLLYVMLCFLLVLYAPYWIYIPVLFIGVVIFSRFYEVIAFSAFIDYYYGAHLHAGTPLAFPFAIVAALIMLAFIELRERLRITHI